MTPEFTALHDPRDRAVFGQTPLIPMPRFGTLDPLPIGRRRYLGAADGLYVQARHRALELTLPLASARLPFGTLTAQVHLPGGLIPRALYEEIEERVLERAPDEWAGLVHWDETAERYRLTEPAATHRSAHRISYDATAIDRARLVLDIHSHGFGRAFFSATDDESDQFGFYFATVLGLCQSRESLVACTRLVVDGQYFDVGWHPWESGGAASHEGTDQ